MLSPFETPKDLNSSVRNHNQTLHPLNQDLINMAENMSDSIDVKFKKESRKTKSIIETIIFSFTAIFLTIVIMFGVLQYQNTQMIITLSKTNEVKHINVHVPLTVQPIPKFKDNKKTVQENLKPVEPIISNSIDLDSFELTKTVTKKNKICKYYRYSFKNTAQYYTRCEYKHKK